LHTTRRSDPRRAKVRDMGRSVLPSTARKGAREEIRDAHHNARRRQNRILDELNPAACNCDDPDAVDCPLCDADLIFTNPQRKVKYAVRDRRGADKVAPLIRWADAQIPEGTYPDEAHAMMKAMLPDGLIGDHAMTHLSGVLPERNPAHYGWGVMENEDGELERVHYPWYRGPEARRRFEERRLAVVTRSRVFAEWVIRSGNLGEFNKLGAVGRKPSWADTHWEYGRGEIQRPWRALLGAHDIDDWVKSEPLRDEYVTWAKERGWKDPLD